jgi:hypothetical protein
MPDVPLEQLLDRFEDAWQRGERPDIDLFLPAGSDRLLALVELVHIDLERRLKSGEPILSESYLSRYPDLGDPTILVELLAAEFQLRSRYDPAVVPDEYVRRFPSLRAAVSAFTAPAKPARCSARLGVSCTSSWAWCPDGR